LEVGKHLEIPISVGISLARRTIREDARSRLPLASYVWLVLLQPQQRSGLRAPLFHTGTVRLHDLECDILGHLLLPQDVLIRSIVRHIDLPHDVESDLQSVLHLHSRSPSLPVRPARLQYLRGD